MIKKACVVISLVSTIAAGSRALADDTFSRADALFAQRAEGFAKATEARNAYGALLSQLQGKDLIYAVGQMSRLDLYRGGMSPGLSNAERKKVFDECIQNVAHIKDSGSEEYYYYYSGCLASAGKYAGQLERVSYGLMLRKIQTRAVELATNGSGYEGGGIARVFSAVRGNRKAKPLGLYNPEEAVQLASRTLQTASTKVRPYPNPMSGKDYYENFFYLAGAELVYGIEKDEIGQVNKAIETLGTAISEVDSLDAVGGLPEGREPEIRWYAGMMGKLKTVSEGCVASGSWRNCLANALDNM